MKYHLVAAFRKAGFGNSELKVKLRIATWPWPSPLSVYGSVEDPDAGSNRWE